MNTTIFPDGRTADEQKLFTKCLQKTSPPGGERRIDPRLEEIGEHTVRVNGAGKRLLDGAVRTSSECDVVDAGDGTWATEPTEAYQERRKRTIVQALTLVQQAYDEGRLDNLKARSKERADQLEEKVEWLHEVQATEQEWLARARQRVWEGDGDEQLGKANSDRPFTAEVYPGDTWRKVRDEMKERCWERTQRIRKKKRQRNFRRYIPEVVKFYRDEWSKYVEETSEGNDYPKPQWWDDTEKLESGQQNTPERGELTEPKNESEDPLITGYHAPEYALDVRDKLEEFPSISTFSKLKGKFVRPGKVDTVKRGIGYDSLPKEEKGFPRFKSMVKQKTSELAKQTDRS